MNDRLLRSRILYLLKAIEKATITLTTRNSAYHFDNVHATLLLFLILYWHYQYNNFYLVRRHTAHRYECKSFAHNYSFTRCFLFFFLSLSLSVSLWKLKWVSVMGLFVDESLPARHTVTSYLCFDINVQRAIRFYHKFLLCSHISWRLWKSYVQLFMWCMSNDDKIVQSLRITLLH